MTKLGLPRRTFLIGCATALLPRTALAQAPAVIPSERMRPAVAQGVMSGDLLGDRAMIWSRTDRPARLWVEYALSPKLHRGALLRSSQGNV